MEDKQRLLRLGRGYNGFFCPDTRFHLMGGIKPQGVYPADIPLSESVVRGLRGGSLIDVYNAIDIVELMTPKEKAAHDAKASISAKPVQIPVVEVADIIEETQPEEQTNVQTNERTIETTNVQDEDELFISDEPFLTEDEIKSTSKSKLIEAIKTEGLALDELGLNSRSNEKEVKAALRKYLGYEE